MPFTEKKRYRRCSSADINLLSTIIIYRENIILLKEETEALNIPCVRKKTKKILSVLRERIFIQFMKNPI